MPIYVYSCTHCGLEQEILQKIHDAPLTICPSCNEATFSKQVTAAGFQLKGSGWYVTDFKNNSQNKSPSTKTTSEGTVSTVPASDTSGANEASVASDKSVKERADGKKI